MLAAGYRVLTGPFPAPKRGRPVFIAVVDVSASEEFLELAKLALTAALDALTPNTLVGLITLSDTVRFCLGSLRPTPPHSVVCAHIRTQRSALVSAETNARLDASVRCGRGSVRARGAACRLGCGTSSRRSLRCATWPSSPAARSCARWRRRCRCARCSRRWRRARRSLRRRWRACSRGSAASLASAPPCTRSWTMRCDLTRHSLPCQAWRLQRHM